MRSIIIHIIIGVIIEPRYATSVRAFGPDKKPQFLERARRTAVFIAGTTHRV
jgi:hypothetical protein